MGNMKLLRLVLSNSINKKKKSHNGSCFQACTSISTSTTMREVVQRETMIPSLLRTITTSLHNNSIRSTSSMATTSSRRGGSRTRYNNSNSSGYNKKSKENIGSRRSKGRDSEVIDISGESGTKANHTYITMASDSFHRHNSNSNTFLCQYYSLLKMERQIHLLCHQYLQRLQQQLQVVQSDISTTSKVPSGDYLFLELDKLQHKSLYEHGNGDNAPPQDLFLQLASTKKTSPVKINELPTPNSLLLYNEITSKFASQTSKSIFDETDQLYKEILTISNKVGVSWCNLSASTAHQHSPPSSEVDFYYTPCNILRAQKWLYALEGFYSARQDLLQHNFHNYNNTSPSTTDNNNTIFGKVTSFMCNVFTSTTTTTATNENQINISSNGSGSGRCMDSTYPNIHQHPQQELFAHRREIIDFQNTDILYQSIITAYNKAHTSRPHYSLTKKMEALLSHMDSSSSLSKPNFAIFTILLRHYGNARGDLYYVARKADALLQRMDAELSARANHHQQRYGKLEEEVSPSIAITHGLGGADHDYSSHHYSKDVSSNVGKNDECGLEDDHDYSTALQGSTSTAIPSPPPVVTSETIMLVMRAYSRVKQSLPAALRCEALLERMEKAAELDGNLHLAPSTDAYNTCLRAFFNVNNNHIPSTTEILKSSGSNSISEKQLHANTITSHVESIVSRMEANQQKVKEDDNNGVIKRGSPNTMTYNLAIAIFSASSQKKDNKKARYLIKFLERSSIQKQQDTNSDTVSGTTIGPPSTFAYNSYLLSTLARIKKQQKDEDDKKIKSCTDILDAVERLYNNMVSHSVSKPDYTTYDTMFSIYRLPSKYDKDAGDRAELLLSRMEVQYATGSNNLVKPDARMYSHAIKCRASSKYNNKTNTTSAVRAYAILKKMELQTALGNKELQPDASIYASVINACSSVSEVEHQPVALSIAFDCYNTMLSLGFSPNAVTYSCLLKCCTTLLPYDSKQRKELAQQVFEAACEQGQVNAVVENSLKRASPELYRLYQKQEEKKDHSSRVPKRLLVDLSSSASMTKNTIN